MAAGEAVFTVFSDNLLHPTQHRCRSV